MRYTGGMERGEAAKRIDERYRYAQYASWPEDERWELIRGVAYSMSPAPRLSHQGLLRGLFLRIATYFEAKPCQAFVAPVDVFFPHSPDQDIGDVDTVVQPDILVVCDGAKLRDEGIWGAPDWLIEILSPHTKKKDLGEKFDLYETSGVREYWVIDPGDQSLLIYRLAEGGRFSGGLSWEATPRRNKAPAGSSDDPALLSRTDSDLRSPLDFPGLRIDLRDLFAAAKVGTKT